MILGIVGHAAEKFTPETEAEVKGMILAALSHPDVTGLASGGCHMGGVDLWAEEAADYLGLPKQIFLPKTRSWSGGYKERNLQIAAASDCVISYVVRRLPPGYSGMTFHMCYHCGTVDHIKSGGCWTVKQAIKMGKQGLVVVI